MISGLGPKRRRGATLGIVRNAGRRSDPSVLRRFEYRCHWRKKCRVRKCTDNHHAHAGKLLTRGIHGGSGLGAEMLADFAPFLEQASAVRRFERLGLQGIVLMISLGDAGISKQRTAVGRSGAFRKRTFANRFGRHDGSSRFCCQYGTDLLRNASSETRDHGTARIDRCREPRLWFTQDVRLSRAYGKCRLKLNG